MVLSHRPAVPTAQAFFHRTPAEALGQVLEQTLSLEGRSFTIRYPGDPDALLDHPATHAAFEQDEYMPYWADLWPSALMLGRALLQRDWGDWQPPNPAPVKALEIGCGVGLPGIVALSLGMAVTFSDYDAAALDFAAANARANGFERFEILPLDWRVPPSLRVELLLASDVLYEQRNIEPLIQLIATVLTEEGQCWLVDPNRPWQGEFCQALEAAALSYATVEMVQARAAYPSVEGKLFRIGR